MVSVTVSRDAWVGKFSGVRREFGVKMAEKGAEVTSKKKKTAESGLENLIKMCNFCRCSLCFGQG